MPDVYVCPHCGAEVERSFSVQYLVRSCSSCGEHGRFVHEAVAAALKGMSAEERESLPDGWDDQPLDERLLTAVREGVLDLSELRP